MWSAASLPAKASSSTGVSSPPTSTCGRGSPSRFFGVSPRQTCSVPPSLQGDTAMRSYLGERDATGRPTVWILNEAPRPEIREIKELLADLPAPRDPVRAEDDW